MFINKLNLIPHSKTNLTHVQPIDLIWSYSMRGRDLVKLEGTRFCFIFVLQAQKKESMSWGLCLATQIFYLHYNGLVVYIYSFIT